MEKRVIQIQCYHSPCGDLTLGSFGDELCLCDWTIGRHGDAVRRRLQRLLRAEYEEGCSDVLREAVRQLDGYFRRDRMFFDVPLLFAGTDFQRMVWNKLLEIPYGSTISYGELARMLDVPKAIRAVANANGANAVSIIVPCHRVIGGDRSLTGYGGGLKAKRMLLELECGSGQTFFLD